MSKYPKSTVGTLHNKRNGGCQLRRIIVKMQKKRKSRGKGVSAWMCTKNLSYCENAREKKKSGGGGGGVRADVNEELKVS